jgi:hypothetical protein
VDFVPVDVSATVAVYVIVFPRATFDGLGVMVVLVLFTADEYEYRLGMRIKIKTTRIIFNGNIS